MLSAAELRIGNYIDYTTEREIVTMQTTYEYIRLIHNGNKNFKPIPLNEEWLLNFGFDKNQSPNKDIQVGVVNDDFANNIMSVVWRGFILVKIQHVHQLQNLFYCLCGEELTLIK
jgi:hypothetical protein